MILSVFRVSDGLAYDMAYTLTTIMFGRGDGYDGRACVGKEESIECGILLAFSRQ